MRVNLTKLLVAAIAAAPLLWNSAAPAVAQSTITIGFGSEPTSADPHYHGTSANMNLRAHLFSPLVDTDENMRSVPALATAWRKIDDKTWEFDLRKGVTFHDGTPFTADDVAFTFQRAVNVPGSPSSLRGYIGGMTVEVVDPHKILIRTAEPDPLVLNEVSAIGIVSRKHGEKATTDDYNAGRATIGTGPYKFGRWTQGSQLVLERNPDYWGDKPDWDHVVMRFMTSGPARTAALLSGSVDLIENVPTVDYRRLNGDPKLTVVRSPANRMMYLALDQFREDSPFVRGINGEKIKNPFLDLRVRQAVSKAIDREAIVDLIMDGAATPAGQYVLPVMFGAHPDLKPEAYDPEGAKKLLAEAGYPNGFSLTIHGANDRFVNDGKALEAVGQMLSSIGIRTKVDSMPASVAATRASTGGANKTPEFSFHLWGFGGQTGDASSALNFLVHSVGASKSFGTANRGRFSDPDLDKLIQQAVTTMDDDKRRELLAQATKSAVDQLAVTPLYYLENVWAMRKGLTYQPSVEERTLAFKIRKAN